ncbi:MAG: PKD domain-containing protein, partial [Candidatus Heimdallarchaeota archaeon]
LSDQDRVLRLKLIVGHQMQFVRYLDFLELTLYSLSNSLTNPRNPDTDGDGLVDSFEVEGWDIEVNGVIIHVTADPTMTDSDGDGLTDYEEAPYKEEDFPIHATESNIIQGSLYCGGLSDTYAKDPSFPAIQELGTEGVMGFSRPVTEVDYAFVIPSTISVAEISQFSISVAAIALTLQGRSPHDTAWSVQLEDLFGEWQEIRSIPEAPGTWMLDWTYFPPLSFDISTYLSDQDRVLRLKLIVGHQMELIRYLDFLELTLYRIFGSLTDPRNPDTDGNGISDYDEYFDTVPPIVTLSINDDAPSTNSRSVSLTITATDNSGLAQMRFKNAGEDDWTAWEPFATSRSWMLPSGDGPKMIFVQVSDGVGNIGEGSDTILLQTLLADAGDDQSVNEGTPVSFQGTIINPGAGEPYTFEWDFGDGNTASDALAPTHTYVDDGIYTVTLTVSDADAGVATDTLIVTVLNVAPTASIDAITQLQGFTLAELTVLMLDPVFFTGSAADPGSDDLTFTWDWGDGTSPTVMIYLNDPPSYPVVIEEILEHTYMEPEEYLLTLTVEDDDGGIGTATVTLTVWGPRNLKINVTSELEALKTGEKCLDRRLNRIIGYIELSLNEKYWVNATHLTSQYGYCVFLYELFAEIHLQIHNELYNHLIPVLEKWIEHLQAQGSDTTWLEEKLARMRTLLPVFESALYKLAKADELLARVAIMDAEDMPVQNPKWQQKVDHLLTKTHEHMMKSAEYVENGQFIAAISHYKVAWKFAQDALKWAIKSN